MLMPGPSDPIGLLQATGSFTHIDFGPKGGPFDLYPMNADGSDVTPLTQTPDFENQADWGTHT